MGTKQACCLALVTGVHVNWECRGLDGVRPAC